MASSIISSAPLGSPWATIDPFLICVHHVDDYPRGNAGLGPDAAPAARPQAGSMATGHDWSMYFGDTVPGFPAHPHRGFETITIVRRGTVDHADSLGASARFGAGDVQWLTAGSGIVHAEMFPLLDAAGPNPLELFQIWLNLPARSKMADPAFTMFWAGDIPSSVTSDGATELRYIAGAPADGDLSPSPAPPPNSWAADPSADVAIWTIAMAPGARWTLPAAAGPATRRQLFFFKGDSLTIDGATVTQASAIEVRCAHAVDIVNGPAPYEIMMLQARPIMEPVAQAGPFVMNSPDELRQAYADYRRTRYGGWPWDSDAPVHGPGMRRFASM